MFRPKLATRLLVGAVLLTAAGSAWAARKLDAPSPLKGAIAVSEASLTWSDISGETGFLIERRLASGGTFAEIGKTVAGVTSYKDILVLHEIHEYRVRAYRTGPSVIYSDYTNTVAVEPLCP